MKTYRGRFATELKTFNTLDAHNEVSRPRYHGEDLERSRQKQIGLKACINNECAEDARREKICIESKSSTHISGKLIACGCEYRSYELASSRFNPGRPDGVFFGLDTQIV